MARAEGIAQEWSEMACDLEVCSLALLGQVTLLSLSFPLINQGVVTQQGWRSVTWPVIQRVRDFKILESFSAFFLPSKPVCGLASHLI